MPRWSATERAARKIDALASMTAAMTTSTDVRPRQSLANGCRGERTGDLARLVPAHAVGDGEHLTFGDVRVLVLGAHQSGMGGGAPGLELLSAVGFRSRLLHLRTRWRRP